MPMWNVKCEWQAVADLFAVNELGERELAGIRQAAHADLQREVAALVPDGLEVPPFAADDIAAARDKVRATVKDLLPDDVVLSDAVEYTNWKVRPTGHELENYTFRTDLGRTEPQPWTMTVVDKGTARQAYVRLHIIVDQV